MSDDDEKMSFVTNKQGCRLAVWLTRRDEVTFAAGNIYAKYIHRLGVYEDTVKR